MLYWVGGWFALQRGFLRTLAHRTAGRAPGRERRQDGFVSNEEDREPARLSGLLQRPPNLEGSPGRGAVAGFRFRKGSAVAADGGQLDPLGPGRPLLGCRALHPLRPRD